MKNLNFDSGEFDGLRIGDTIQIQKISRKDDRGLLSNTYSHLSEDRAIVVGFASDYEWRSKPTHLKIRVLRDYPFFGFIPIDWVSLLEKGPGSFVLGVTHPYTPSELKQQRYDAFHKKWIDHDLTYQGFTNSSTFHAFLYISQDQSLLKSLRYMVRADGSIHPNKIEKAYFRRGHIIDPWCLEIPLEIPSEFRSYSFSHKHRLKPNWTEVSKHVVCLIKETS